MMTQTKIRDATVARAMMTTAVVSGQSAGAEGPASTVDVRAATIEPGETFSDGAPDSVSAELPAARGGQVVAPIGRDGETRGLSVDNGPFGSSRTSSDAGELITADDPEVAQLGALAVDGASVVSENQWRSTDLHYLSDDVRVQMIFELKDEAAPGQFDVDVALPEGSRLESSEAFGAVFVVNAYDDIVGVFAEPWAVDADGDQVPTEFEVVGNTLRQHVDHEGAEYPVMADPDFTWGFVTGTAYFSRQETKDAQTQVGAALIAAGLCAFFGPATLGAACAISAAVYSQWTFQANRAFNEGRCLKIKIPIFEAGSYSFGDRICTDSVD